MDQLRPPGWTTVILVTRFNGPPLALNCDLIERAEATPDTVLTLVDGTKYVVAESVEDVIIKIREFRASILVLASRLEIHTPDEPNVVLRLLTDPTGEG
jgi:flagellar protein FlbD